MYLNAVFAAASSRLHADVIVTRLKRAGISSDRISAIFPQSQTPNCALCWLEGRSAPTNFEGETVVVAGPLHSKVSLASREGLTNGLEKIGLSSPDAAIYADHLSNGDILICVHPVEDADVSIAWHLFRELQADAIGVAMALEKTPTKARSWFKKSGTRSVGPAPLGLVQPA